MGGGTEKEGEMSDDTSKVVTDKSADAGKASSDQIERTARRLRHIGYGIFGGLALITAIFLTVEVIGGMRAGEVQDPETGAQVPSGLE